jgi:hypothetical protein
MRIQLYTDSQQQTVRIAYNIGYNSRHTTEHILYIAINEKCHCLYACHILYNAMN